MDWHPFYMTHIVYEFILGIADQRKSCLLPTGLTGTIGISPLAALCTLIFSKTFLLPRQTLPIEVDVYVKMKGQSPPAVLWPVPRWATAFKSLSVSKKIEAIPPPDKQRHPNNNRYHY